MFKVFLIEPTDQARYFLRRYSSRNGAPPCPSNPGKYSYHDTMVRIEDGPDSRVISDDHSHSDPRWPTQCDCGYIYQDSDQWQLFHRTIYKHHTTGELMTIEDAPVGACWNAWWEIDRGISYRTNQGADGRSLVVKTPGGEWNIDSRASNCTKPDDNVHRCWVRHGSPEIEGSLTVDKNGNTCAAGAGSISLPRWHGFLRNGFLVVC